jgi:putative salt-induced outer membrane protein
MIRIRTIAAIVYCGMVTSALAEPPPEPIARLITEAAKTGNPVILKDTADLAKRTYPASAAEIDALIANLQAQAEAARVAKLREQGFFEGWSGEGEIGASQSTGSTRNTTIAAGMKLNKNGLDWQHHLAGIVDYQHSNGNTTANREVASYEADYKFSPQIFISGFVQWEQDRFAGFNRRFTESLGLGYNILGGPVVTWLVSGGPALRQAAFTNGRTENDISARVASSFLWNITAATLFSEDAGVYVGGRDNTYSSTTAITTKIFGDLSARLSFNINIESNPPPGIENTSTISRFTLVYNF